MFTRLQVVLTFPLLLVVSVGCSSTAGTSGEPADPKAAEVLSSHWNALKRGDWQLAYDQLHPDLKVSGLTLRQFTAAPLQPIYDEELSPGARDRGDRATGRRRRCLLRPVFRSSRWWKSCAGPTPTQGCSPKVGRFLGLGYPRSPRGHVTMS